MKRLSLLVIIFLAAGVIVSGCAKGYESERPAGDLRVILKADRYPLVRGDNAVTVKITDTAGKPVANADVNVRYYMPPMPGMPPMDYNTHAAKKGDVYVITANIPMEGGWKFEVSVVEPGKPSAVATFNLDSR